MNCPCLACRAEERSAMRAKRQGIGRHNMGKFLWLALLGLIAIGGLTVATWALLLAECWAADWWGQTGCGW